MAEILISDLCDCRPPLLVGGFLMPQGSAAPGSVASLKVESRPRFSLFPLFSALFLRLFSIVLAPAGFSPPLQCLAL
jgi:hypothetical protein